MKTTVTLQDQTARELMEKTGAESAAAAVRKAIEEYLRWKRKEELISLRGRVEIDAEACARVREAELEESDPAEN